MIFDNIFDLEKLHELIENTRNNLVKFQELSENDNDMTSVSLKTTSNNGKITSSNFSINGKSFDFTKPKDIQGARTELDKFYKTGLSSLIFDDDLKKQLNDYIDEQEKALPEQEKALPAEEVEVQDDNEDPGRYMARLYCEEKVPGWSILATDKKESAMSVLEEFFNWMHDKCKEENLLDD